MKKIRISIMAFLCISLMAASAYAMKMNIDPARAEIAMKPGEEKTGSVTILNYDETPVHVKAYIQDLVYLPDGSNDFLKPGSTPWSAADWIKIGPTEFDVLPGKQETVRYVVSAPKDAKGGRYGVIFFESVTPPSQANQTGATANVRLGTIMLVTVDGTSMFKAKLAGIQVTPPVKDAPLEISWTVFNGGNILIRPNGTATIIDENKNEVAKIDLNKEKSGMLPQTNRKFSTKYDKKLAKGNYFLQVVLDYGGEALLGGQVKFTIE